MRQLAPVQRLRNGTERWKPSLRACAGGTATCMRACNKLGAHSPNKLHSRQVTDPYANEPARHPALIVRSQKPMNSGVLVLHMSSFLDTFLT